MDSLRLLIVGRLVDNSKTTAIPTGSQTKKVEVER